MAYTKPTRISVSEEAWELLGEHLVSTQGHYSPSDYLVSLFLNGILDNKELQAFDVVEGKITSI